MQNYLGVIPAKAGIHIYQGLMDPRFRGGDKFIEFCNYLSKVLMPLNREESIQPVRFGMRELHCHSLAGGSYDTSLYP